MWLIKISIFIKKETNVINGIQVWHMRAGSKIVAHESSDQYSNIFYSWKSKLLDKVELG